MLVALALALVGAGACSSSAAHGGRGGAGASGGRAGSGGEAPSASGGGGAGGGAGASGGGGGGGRTVSAGGAAGLQGGSGGGTAGGGGQSSHPVKLPTGNAPFDYQIGGAYPPPAGVTVVSRDRGDAPAAGLYNICYVNGFQVQINEAAAWMAEHADLILRTGQGQPVVDPDWNEMLMDTRTAAKREGLLKVVGPWIDACAAKGFDAVELDNLDSYSRSQGLLTEDDNVAFMSALSARAHAAGLAAGQKNAADLAARAAALGTDFAVAEECNRYQECDVYRQAYGTRVFVIEYRRQDFDAGCAAEPDLSIVLRDLGVTTPGSSTYVFAGC